MKLTRLVLLTMFVSGSVFAQDVEIVGQVKQSIKVPQKSLKVSAAPKVITLLKVKLTDKAKQTIAKRAQVKFPVQARSLANNAKSKQLGMNNVPVLDQGAHGTCATFAVTAAVDALLDKGDYVSQLCQLQLGQHLENSGYTPSGWDGSWGRIVLNQMSMFGVVSKENQIANGCGGLTEYPVYAQDVGADMSLSDYHQVSEALPEEDMAWSPILDVYQALLDKTDTIKTISEIKTAIQAGDRVAFGVLLVDFNLGVVGAVGTHHATNDTWVLTPQITRDLYLGAELAGHEMVITGYDDDAVAIDDNGYEHRGLFTLRNSWGDSVGDKGDFYMSYDYVKTLMIEALRVRNLKTEG